jgi:hypothetical protein
MSINQFQVTSYVLDEVFVRFVNYLAFAKVANRNLEGDFKSLQYATGQTLNYRLEERYLGGEGATATEEARVQLIRPLTIEKQFNTMLSFNPIELTFDRARDQPYLDMMLNPRAKTLANKVEKYIATDNFQSQVYQAVGTPGVTIDFNTITIADAYMTELGIPDDGNRYFAVPPRVAAALANSLSTIFNMTVNRGALLDGFIGHLSGFDFFKTNFLTQHIAGSGAASGGTPPTGYQSAGTITNGPITGGNTFTITGLIANQTGIGSTPYAFKKGDILTIDASSNVYMINPLTYQPLSQTAQFVVAADAPSDGSGNATITVNQNVPIVVSGARQNISTAIPNGAQLYMAQTHNRSIAFHNQAVVFAAPPIKELKGGVEAMTTFSDLYKMSLTYTLGADIRNYIQLDRLDTLAGVQINPEFAVLVMS